MEILDMEFRIITNSMLRVLTDKVDSMEEQRGNVTREMENLRRH